MSGLLQFPFQSIKQSSGWWENYILQQASQINYAHTWKSKYPQPTLLISTSQVSFVAQYRSKIQTFSALVWRCMTRGRISLTCSLTRHNMTQRHGRGRRGFPTVLLGLKCNLGAADFLLSAAGADGLELTRLVKEKKELCLFWNAHNGRSRF